MSPMRVDLVQSGRFKADFYTDVAVYEVELLRLGLEAARGNMIEAGNLLNLTYHQIRHLLEKYELDPREFRPVGDITKK